jgi:tRNA pseudouridine55 synthase
MDGILLIDKPAGWTSFDVVAKVRGVLTDNLRRLHRERGFCIESQGAKRASSAESRTEEYGERATEPSDKAMASKESQSDGFAGAWRCRCKIRVGHSGTLDPFATGLLILLIGKYTKQSDQFLKLDKTYEATLKLGKTSSTGDPEGEIVEYRRSKNENRPLIPSQEEVISALNKFIGVVIQTPPIFSAIKIDGQRAYKLARAGKKPIIEPRQVTIYDIKLIDYSYPILKIETKVSSGTYIRSLAVDIGESLGVGAYLSELRRTKIAQFDLDKTVSPKKISTESLLDKIHNNVV